MEEDFTLDIWTSSCVQNICVLILFWKKAGLGDRSDQFSVQFCHSCAKKEADGVFLEHFIYWFASIRHHKDRDDMRKSRLCNFIMACLHRNITSLSPQLRCTWKTFYCIDVEDTGYLLLACGLIVTRELLMKESAKVVSVEYRGRDSFVHLLIVSLAASIGYLGFRSRTDSLFILI